MDFFLKKKSTTVNKNVSPSITSSMFGGKSTGTSVTNGDKIVNTAKKAASTIVDTTTPKTTLKNNKQITTPVRNNANKNKKRKSRSSEKKRKPKNTKQAAFMANFFGAKKKKKKLVVETSDGKNDTLDKASASVVTKPATTKISSNNNVISTTTSSSLSLNNKKRPVSELRSSPSASSPENTNRATGSASKSSSSSKKKKTLNMFFMAKKQKKLTMDNSNNVAVTTTSDTKMDVDVNSPAKEARNIQLTTSTKTLEEGKQREEEESDEDSEDSSSDESGLEDDEIELVDIDPKQLELQAQQKLKEAEAMKAKARAKAEAEAARIREAAAKVLKEQEEKEYQENLIIIKETMDRMLNITTLDVLRERCTNNGDDMNIKDVVYCYDMTGVRLDSVIAPCGLLYKADVLKIGMRKFGGKKSKKEREKAYTIHFHGFSKKWDTQVPQSRLLNVNAASDEVCEASEIIYDIERKKWDEEEAKLVEEEERLAAEAKAREPPKAEVLHQAAVQRLATTTLPIVLDTCLNGGTATVLNLGELKPGHLYNSQKQLFPVGYQSEFLYTSYKDATATVTYLQTLKQGLSGSKRPIFEIKLLGEGATEDDVFQGNNANSAWKNINNRLRVQTKTQGISYKKVNGTEAFGFSNKQIVALLEGLPNVMDANGYVFQDRRIFEGIEEEKSSTKGNAKTTSKNSNRQKVPAKKPLPDLSPKEKKRIHNNLVEYSTKYKELLTKCATFQSDAKRWRKQRVLRKFGTQFKKGENEHFGKMNEFLVSDENLQIAIVKFIQGSRATLSQLIKNILKTLKQKRSKVDEQSLATFITTQAKRVHIAVKPSEDCSTKEEENENMEREPFWVWMVKKPEFIFKNVKNVYKPEKQQFRDLKSKMDSFSKYVTQYKKCIAILKDEYVTIQKCLNCEESIKSAGMTYETDTLKYKQRYDKACESNKAELEAMKEKELRRIEREKMWKEKRLAREQEKIERRRQVEIRAAERAALKAEKERQILLAKQLKQQELEKRKLTSFGLTIKRSNSLSGQTGSANTNGMSSKKLMKSILIPLVQELVEKAYGNTLVQDLDNLLQLNSAGTSNFDNNALFQEFKDRCVASKKIKSQIQKGQTSNRKQLLQFSENQRPAFWGNYYFATKNNDEEELLKENEENTIVSYNHGTTISKLAPLTQDPNVIASYELDSDEEWEDGAPAEELGSDIEDDEEDDKDGNKEGENENDLDFADGWLLGDDEVIYEGENPNNLGGKNMMSGDYESDSDSDAYSDDENALKARRVPSTYFLWLNNNREKIKAEAMKKEDFQQSKVAVLVSKCAGELWKALTDEDKKPYISMREKLLEESKAEFEALKLANKDKPKERRKKKKHKFANNSEIGHELVVGVLYDLNEDDKSGNVQAGTSQLLQYNVMPLTSLPIKINMTSADEKNDDASSGKNALGFKRLSMKEYRKKQAIQREAKRVKMEAEKAEKRKKREMEKQLRQLKLEKIEQEKLERMKQREKEKQDRLAKLEQEKLEKAKKREKVKQLKLEKLEQEKQLKINREAERERLRLEKKRIADLKLKEKLEKQKEKEIKAVHLEPFYSSIHNKVKKAVALDAFYARFPMVGKKQTEKLLKLICVRESRDFDRIKWYVKDEFRTLILKDPDECMKKINEMSNNSNKGKRKLSGDVSNNENTPNKKKKE